MKQVLIFLHFIFNLFIMMIFHISMNVLMHIKLYIVYSSYLPYNKGILYISYICMCIYQLLIYGYMIKINVFFLI